MARDWNGKKEDTMANSPRVTTKAETEEDGERLRERTARTCIRRRRLATNQKRERKREKLHSLAHSREKLGGKLTVAAKWRDMLGESGARVAVAASSKRGQAN